MYIGSPLGDIAGPSATVIGSGGAAFSLAHVRMCGVDAVEGYGQAPQVQNNDMSDLVRANTFKPTPGGMS